MTEPMPGVARLRRAAAVLRERAERANWGPPGDWVGQSQRWEYQSGSTLHMDGSGDFTIRADGLRSSRLMWGMERGAVGEWAATVDPVVGLTLAAWLDKEAQREAHSLAEFGFRVVANEAHELARLVLREDEGGQT